MAVTKMQRSRAAREWKLTTPPDQPSPQPHKLRAVMFVPICSLLLAGCALEPNYRSLQSADLGVPANYLEAPDGQTPDQIEVWWKQFGDAELDTLVERALSGNLDLAQARSRLIQARESSIQTRASGLPSVSANGSVSRNLDSNGNGQTSFSLGTDASWEADLFGGRRRSIEAGKAVEEAAAFDLAAIRVSLIGDVATNYVQARLAQQRLALARQNLIYAEDNLQIAQWRRQAGLVSSLDVEQARGARAQIAATLPTFTQSYAQAVFRLGVLTGQVPEALAAELVTAAPLPKAPDRVAAGFPAETLRQRPDVRSAERNLAAATARVGVAKAQLYPSLQIGGSIGTNALSLGGLADLVTGNLFARLTQTIFDGGRLKSQVRSQQAAAQGVLAQYRQSVLSALEDVERALVAVQTAERRGAELAEALDAARNQAILARSNYRAGISDFQAQLEAERSLVSASDGMLTAEGDRTLAVIQLYRALGGGWDPANPAQD